MLLLSLALSSFAAPSGPYVDVDYACVESPLVGSVGLVHHPVDCRTRAPIQGLPVVLFITGAGYSSSSYNTLAKHLAGNGYITVISSTGLAASTRTRATTAVTTLANFETHWSGASTVSGDLVLAGHSRGGEAAVIAASLIAGTWDKKAIVALAPTDQSEQTVVGTKAHSYLVITGAIDSDIRGRRVDVSNWAALGGSGRLWAACGYRQLGP